MLDPNLHKQGLNAYLIEQVYVAKELKMFPADFS
jgi:hypothetical protein